MKPYVLPLTSAAADRDRVGGKGAALARLTAAGLPVPDGFCITTAAYRDFVDDHALYEAILTAVQDNSPEVAADRVARMFTERPLPATMEQMIMKAYAGLGSSAAVAVRSSATAEDLPTASFAGQQDTFLNVRGRTELLEAIRNCWASLWTARAIEYRTHQAISHRDVNLAVVVQHMVPATGAGVIFTADPIKRRSDRLLINAAPGVGEALVSGDVDPDSITVERADRTIVERSGEPILQPGQVDTLVRIGLEIEELFGHPVDIEWATDRGQVRVLQARPITTVLTQDREEWNDTGLGDFAWTAGNVGEAVPSVMTPATWSLMQVFMSEAMALSQIGPYRLVGNIGGRLYVNLSVLMAASKAVGVTRLVRPTMERVFGRFPDDLQIPPLPLSRRRVLRDVLRTSIPFSIRVGRYQRQLPALLQQAPARADLVRQRIGAATSARQLAQLWADEVEPLLRHNSRLLAAGARATGSGQLRARAWLVKRVGAREADAMLTGLDADGDDLESLGPMLGLARVAAGDLDRNTYLRQWGHRCPDEFEVSAPRPIEDPDWIDDRLAELVQGRSSALDLIESQQRARAAAWSRFQKQHPGMERAAERRLARVARSYRAREAGRSEAVRAFGVLREFILRAGDITGHHDDLFFCSHQEILAVLDGDSRPLDQVPKRREAYHRYTSLPRYPPLIRGAFDPAGEVAVSRPTDDHQPSANTVIGLPGSAGVAEGTARILDQVEQSDQLGAGDILVTTVTNVGWTPLFPRVAAIVTDIGAPLSHAAIVARELGIPAVVGCGDATTKINNGDLLRVDGATGTVQVLPGSTPDSSAGCSSY